MRGTFCDAMQPFQYGWWSFLYPISPVTAPIASQKALHVAAVVALFRIALSSLIDTGMTFLEHYKNSVRKLKLNLHEDYEIIIISKSKIILHNRRAYDTPVYAPAYSRTHREKLRIWHVIADVTAR